MNLIVMQKSCDEVQILEVDGSVIEIIITDAVSRKKIPPKPLNLTAESCILNETSLICKGHEVRSEYYKYLRTYEKLEDGNIKSIQKIPYEYKGANTTFQTFTEVFIKE